MSAFVVSDEHICALVSYGGIHDVRVFERDGGHVIAGNEQETAEILLAANVASVNYRYDENEPVPPIEFHFERPDERTAIEIIKACDCFDYQACERPDYRQSLAATIVEAIRENAIRAVPGYDEAPREIISQVVA